MFNNESLLACSEAPGAAPQLRPGTTLFGVYEILDGPLGGGMGQVFRARHTNGCGLRAIKVIRPDVKSGDREQLRKLFIREAQTLMKLNNEAIVRFHDLLSDQDSLYLVMEFVEGIPLKTLLGQRRLSAVEVLMLRERIGAGLAAAHAMGIAHRDVSPDNIILPLGRVEEAKLIDFGIAADANADGATVVGEFKGKLAYASPEQFGLFGGHVGTKSDIYSFGLVLAEAASGAALPMGATFYEAVEIRKQTPRLPPQVPQDLRDRILPMLAPNPHERAEALSLLPAQPAADPSAARSPESARVSWTFTQPIPAAGPAPRAASPWPSRLAFASSALACGCLAGLLAFAWTAPKPDQTPAPPVQPMAIHAPVAPHTGRTPASPPITRHEIMAEARRMAGHSWRAPATVRASTCPQGPSDWKPGERVTGVPYAWGGSDDVDQFDRKLASGYRPGAHRGQAGAGCSTGIDCSGFVTRAWGMKNGHPYSTATLPLIARDVRLDAFKDLRPGDVLNKPGRHVVLFAGYRPDGNPNVYEAVGASGRVIYNDRSTWARYQGYLPMRYRGVAD